MLRVRTFGAETLFYMLCPGEWHPANARLDLLMKRQSGAFHSWTKSKKAALTSLLTYFPASLSHAFGARKSLSAILFELHLIASHHSRDRADCLP